MLTNTAKKKAKGKNAEPVSSKMVFK